MSLSIINPFVFATGGGGGTPTYLIQSMPTLNSLTNGNQFGWQFTANANFSLTGLRVYLNSTSEETARLWRVSDETLLGSVAITPVALTWSEGLFGAPIALTNGADYVITTRRTIGATRNIRSGDPTGFTFDANVTYVTGRNSTTNTFPTSTSTSWLWGIVDGIYES